MTLACEQATERLVLSRRQAMTEMTESVRDKLAMHVVHSLALYFAWFNCVQPRVQPHLNKDESTRRSEGPTFDSIFGATLMCRDDMLGKQPNPNHIVHELTGP